MPDPNDFTPTPEQLSRIIDRLAAKIAYHRTLLEGNVDASTVRFSEMNEAAIAEMAEWDAIIKRKRTK